MARRRMVHVQGYSRRYPFLGAEHAITSTPLTNDPNGHRLWSGNAAEPGQQPSSSSGQPMVKNVKESSDSGWLWLLLLLAMRKKR